MTADPRGTPLGDPAEFARLAQRARALIGVTTIDSAIAARRSGARGAPPLGVFDIVEAFGQIDEWAQALKTRIQPPDPVAMVRFAMMCMVIDRCAERENSAGVLSRMGASVVADALDDFETAFFEMETAVYWLDQMHAVDVGFGPPSGHPDVWATVAVGTSHIRIAIECKRIQPVATSLREVNHDASAAELEFQQVVAAHGALKCIVWTHGPLSPKEHASVVGSIGDLARALPIDAPSDMWLTAGDTAGAFQISLARLGVQSLFATTGHSVTDVPAEPVLIPRVEVRKLTAGTVESRVKSIFGFRCDGRPDRLRSLRTNLKEAVAQLRTHSSNDIGVVAVRIRKPTALGDLWEADRATRGLLASLHADQVVLVILFWDESDSTVLDENVTIAAGTGIERRVAYSLRPYFVTNKAGRMRFDQIDSQAAVFPAPPTAFVRDPVHGDIRPISPAEFDAMETGADLSPMVSEALSKASEMPQAAGEATIYWKLLGPLSTQLNDMLMGVIRAHERQFRIFLERAGHIRVVEVTARAVRATTTLDLRAWMAQDELCLVLAWRTDGFTASLWLPDESARIAAMSAKVRPVSV